MAIGEIIGSAVKKKNMQLITPEQFSDMTGIVIDNFEGGYYHPDMLKNFKPSDQAKLKASGETMFGLDRKAGAQLAKYPEWATFWAALDAAKKAHPEDFKYNKRGGVYGAQLKTLCAAIMFKWFGFLSDKYLNPDSLQAISNDNRLLIHFSYGCWNGQGWFQKYAAALKAVVPGEKQSVYEAAIKARTESTNTVIRQQGKNMLNLFKRMGLRGR